MRVLIPVHIFLPHHRAGVEAYTAQIARELAKTVDVTVVTTRKVVSVETGTIRHYSLGELPVIEVVNNLARDAFEETWDAPVMEAAFSKVLERVRPDVVHVQHFMYWSLGLPRLARQRGVPCLATLHDFWLMCGRLGQLVDASGEPCPGPSEDRCAPCLAATPWTQSPAARRWIDRLVRVRRLTGIALDGPLRTLEGWRARVAGGGAEPPRPAPAELEPWRRAFHDRTAAFRRLPEYVDLFVTPSETLRRRFVAWGLPADRIVRVPQGLDHAPFRGVVKVPASGVLRLGFIGTIAPHKGVDVLIAAVRRLPADRVRLDVFGPGHQHRDYARRCRRLAAGAANIRFGGRLDAAGVARAHGALDALCVPSLWEECCPLTIQEAFIAGTPCVVSHKGGMAELVRDERGGLTAEPGDVDHWTRVLGRLVDDPGLAGRLAATAPAVPTIGDHVAALRRLYDRTRGPTGPGGS